jgi:hypothetical protein
MKGYVLISVLMAMFFSTAVFSQDPDEEPRPPEEQMEREMHLRHMQLELQEREAELDFQQGMKKLGLEKRKIALKRERRAPHHPAQFKHCGKGKMLPIAIVCFVVHILLTVWVYKDIRQRNSGSGIWIVIVLLTGLFGVLPYAIVRLGDTRQAKS